MNLLDQATAGTLTGAESAYLVQSNADKKITTSTLIKQLLCNVGIDDTSADHQYLFAVSELAADRTITLPLLAGNDTFVFAAFAQALTNKTIHGNANTLTADGTNPVGFRNIPNVGDKTASYTLATGDVGKYVTCGTGSDIVIPNSTFADGDVISLFNNTSGNITITCTITTAYIAGTDADKATMTLSTRGLATILFKSGTVCVVSGNVS